MLWGLVLGLEGAERLLHIVVVLAGHVEVNVVLGLGLDVQLDGAIVLKKQRLNFIIH